MFVPTNQAMHAHRCQDCLLSFTLYTLPLPFENASMQALRQPGMRERHWQQLSEQLVMTLKPDKDFVLSKALDMHLMDHLDTIQKVPFSMQANNLVHFQLLFAAALHTGCNLSLPVMYMVYCKKRAEILSSLAEQQPSIMPTDFSCSLNPYIAL